MKEKVEDMRKEKLECFKLCFRIKVADAGLFDKIKSLEEDWRQSQKYEE